LTLPQGGRFRLHPGCGECPEVEFAGEHVRVGEAGNLAVLTTDEWNVLVDLIQSGTLSKV